MKRKVKNQVEKKKTINTSVFEAGYLVVKNAHVILCYVNVCINELINFLNFLLIPTIMAIASTSRIMHSKKCGLYVNYEKTH